jgi:NAD(P)-dependent dehydrogenase (short-subunit alcohol dehydrogenase family)
MRLQNKTAIVVGAGQIPGQGIGNGRATALRFAQEGASVMAVDRDFSSAEETVSLMTKKEGECFAFKADVTQETNLKAMVEEAQKRWGHIDILHYNVGITFGDTPVLDLDEQAFDKIIAVNLRGAILSCKYVIPVMRQQLSGVITLISSVVAVCNYSLISYKVSKAGMNALTRELAVENAEFGIRVNAISPGTIDAPGAVEKAVKFFGKGRDKVTADRDSTVLLRHKQGTAWDVANAALFLASDEANFITGAILPVDGGSSVNVVGAAPNPIAKGES